MSWTEELYQVYENNCGREFDGEDDMLIPVSHSTAKAQIEVTLRDDGNIINASSVNKEQSTTIIPVTEDSGTRSSGICPMPFADKLVYIGGDYGKYSSGKCKDNSAHFSMYMEQLRKWNESEYSHPAVNAVYKYLEKETLVSDLIEYGILETDEKTGKLKENRKIDGIEQDSSFVRFIVNYSDDFERENRTWLDRTLYDSFISFNQTLFENTQLCYATGKELPVTYKHPAKIRNAGDKAKLISSNDESGFTYRGRFSNKEQAISVGYDFSQKVHKSLSWLISRQGMPFGSMNIIIWASAMQDVDKDLIFKSSDGFMFDDDIDDEPIIPDTEPKHKEILEKMIFGKKESYAPHSKIMIMGVDAATTGRLSVSMYSELESSGFFNNILNWHMDMSWNRFSPKLKQYIFNSFSLYEIINCAFGLEQGGTLTSKPEIVKDNILRLIPCVTEGRSVPYDIVQALFRKASNPLAYEKSYNHRTVLETACGLIKKNNLKRGGITNMAYNPNETDRSYLYGCLLAIADKAESITYDEKDRDSRITNARRYWSSFSSRPYVTWKRIEESLRPYLNKMYGPTRRKYEALLNEVHSKFKNNDYEENTALETSYLLGYHHFMMYMKKDNNKD